MGAFAVGCAAAGLLGGRERFVGVGICITCFILLFPFGYFNNITLFYIFFKVTDQTCTSSLAFIYTQKQTQKL